jgi:hypothetical protein
MKQHWVTFHAAHFEHRTPAPHFLNPRCFGEDIAQWVGPALTAAGLEPGPPIQEDYGWVLWTRSGGCQILLVIGLSDDSPSRDLAEWHIGIAFDPGLSLVKRLFQRPRHEDLLRVAVAVDETLKRDPQIRVVGWHLDAPGSGPSSPMPR